MRTITKNFLGMNENEIIEFERNLPHGVEVRESIDVLMWVDHKSIEKWTLEFILVDAEDSIVDRVIQTLCMVNGKCVAMDVDYNDELIDGWKLGDKSYL